MDDKQETQEEKPEDTATDTGEGNNSEKTTLIDDANLAAKRLEKANERKAELLRQEENLAAKRRLGGTTEAGTAPTGPQYSDEEKASRARIKAVGDASGSAWAKDYE